jgi:NADH-quinone oxidoreductase subunit L
MIDRLLHEEAGKFNPLLAFAATAGAVGMAYLGWSIYARAGETLKPGGRDPAYRYSGDIWDGLESAWYLDQLYNRTVVAGFKGLADYLARVFDPRGVDGLVMGVGRLFGGLATGMRGLQTGFVRNYALVFTLGVLLVLAFMLLVGR